VKILAVDDDPIILELLAQILSVVGTHELTTAANAAEALGTIAQNGAAPFDCFLLDIHMLGLGGVELTRQIHQMNSYAFTPIIMLTARSEKSYIERAFAAGATDYITKPFDLTEFTTRIRITEELVLSRKAHIAAAKPASARLKVTQAAELLDPSRPFTVQGIKGVIDYTAMENYVAQLSRSSLFGSTVFAFTLRKSEAYNDALAAEDFRFLIRDVAQVIADTLSNQHFLMSHAGNGTYLCITRSGYHPDMAQLNERVNISLNNVQIMTVDGTELYPRVSAGAAIRLVWKSGEQISSALATALTTATDAAAEYERLKTDFFQIGKSA